MDDLAVWLGMSPELAEALQLDLLGRLVLAALLGGLIGLEREIQAKPAGLRTNLLICMGAALLMEVSVRVGANVTGGARLPGGDVIGDPGRIAAQIVSGIGFLGAGTILQSRGSITGLTTAATIWVVAAIGMAVGAHAYVEAIGSAVLVVVTLVGLGWLEEALIRRQRAQRYAVTIEPSQDLIRALEERLAQSGLRIESQSYERTAEGVEISLELYGPSREHDALIRELATKAGVLRARRES
ncbi:MAG TPA: MgtC/SapB family protein [Longimicrobiaceae bacterium]